MVVEKKLVIIPDSRVNNMEGKIDSLKTQMEIITPVSYTHLTLPTILLV